MINLYTIHSPMIGNPVMRKHPKGNNQLHVTRYSTVGIWEPSGYESLQRLFIMGLVDLEAHSSRFYQIEGSNWKARTYIAYPCLWRANGEPLTFPEPGNGVIPDHVM